MHTQRQTHTGNIVWKYNEPELTGVILLNDDLLIVKLEIKELS